MNASDIYYHLGEHREDYYGAGVPPIVPANNYCFSSVDEMRQTLAEESRLPFYTRGVNPTTKILQDKLAALEQTEDCLVFASGSAAISAAISSLVSQGDHVVCVQKPYSWTYKLLNQLLSKFGVETSWVDGTQLENFEKAIKPTTKLIFLESPNSWTFEMQDIEAIANLAKHHGIYTMMDNSYASPENCNPATYGIDLIAHSASKYIGGHGDALAGILCGSNTLIKQVFENEFMTYGGVISPFTSWLQIRGLRTLPLRMNRVAESTPPIVDYLANHPKVEKVYYPHHESNPQLDLAKKYLKKPCGQFSVELKTTDKEKIESFCNHLSRFLMACSWGGYESLIFPAVTLYDSQNYSQTTLPINLIRFYVGLEDANDLIADLDQALVHA
ncbi:MAG: aminotransferase class I/II-fold pyridoxal phosphate-dependent enzyme [Bacteroidota bacterium]